ncbi:type II inositol 1,4,5-trisphosphate 5-phosphatase-like [Meleagris gallopavo]|uniref:type II inositol 1,4,5-trisphosphate 5-phosphatase-like n=1 Tax=Meleagris gallopavo TaxID=9103 RepID=UPI00093BD15A|nr:type II inositol 1,4,5-trisphosphate 5-phosphatase-like [Meleagris gallopavo]
MAITAEDVWLEKVIPIAEGFAVEEVIPDGDLHVIGSDVTVRICSEGDGLTVQLPFGSHTRTFLQEVSKCSTGRCEHLPSLEVFKARLDGALGSLGWY